MESVGLEFVQTWSRRSTRCADQPGAIRNRAVPRSPDTSWSLRTQALTPNGFAQHGSRVRDPWLPMRALALAFPQYESGLVNTVSASVAGWCSNCEFES